MISLLLNNLRHITRTKLLVVLISFSFLIQLGGVKLLQSMTVQFNSVVAPLSGENVLFTSLFFQLFTGAFLAAAYGIWMVPYAHQGSRGQLTYTLPSARWKFAVGYALSMPLLLLLQHVVMIVSLAMSFGLSTLFADWGTMKAFLACLALQSIAFETCMFAFALSSMFFGQIPTFFLGAFVIFVLQVAGALFRGIEHFTTQRMEGYERAQSIYKSLPPVGELVFDLNQLFHEPKWNNHYALWAGWLLGFVALFLFKLGRPPQQRVGES